MNRAVRFKDLPNGTTFYWHNHPQSEIRDNILIHAEKELRKKISSEKYLVVSSIVDSRYIDVPRTADSVLKMELCIPISNRVIVGERL